MTYLLDTNVFLWWITEQHKLSAVVLRTIEDGGNHLLLSAGSAMEIATKYAIGKLPLPDVPEHFIPQQMKINSVEPLPITLEHALHTQRLPRHHRDPFDRLLVAQARIENLAIITIDPLIRLYPVQVLW